MKIWKVALFSASAIALSNGISKAQTVAAPSPAVTPAQNRFVTNTPLNPAAAPVITPQDVAPVLGNNPAAPALRPQDIRPVMPGPVAPVVGQPSPTAINPNQRFTTGIGQQGSGTAIGQQGVTGIGQQGFGTAIGQQGIGTAVVPPNGVVIGQPQPFTPPPAALSSPTGLGNAAVTTVPMQGLPINNPGAAVIVPAPTRALNSGQPAAAGTLARPINSAAPAIGATPAPQAAAAGPATPAAPAAPMPTGRR